MHYKKQRKCVLCQNALTSENDTREHILPNAIGGRKTVVGLICRNCNSQTGSKWDAALAEQLSYFSLSFDIARQRGKVPPLTLPTLSGGSLRVHPDGRMTTAKPCVEKISEGSKSRLQITAPTRGELRKVATDLRKGYPQLQDFDIERLIAQAHDVSYYSPDPVEVSITFGGLDAGRSLVKTAMALVFDAGMDLEQCDLALTFLADEKAKPCFGSFYDRESVLVVGRPPHRIIHLAYVRGNSADSTLIGYIELYSWMRYVVCLTESYAGQDFENMYAVDPTNGEELELAVNLESSISRIREAWTNELYDGNVLSDALSSALRIAAEANFRRARQRIVNEAIDRALANSGAEEGTQLTYEQIQRMSKDITDVLAPFIVHNMRRGRCLGGL